jgi:hypothetical protein
MDDFSIPSFLKEFRGRRYEPGTSASSPEFAALLKEVAVFERLHREAYEPAQAAKTRWHELSPTSTLMRPV